MALNRKLQLGLMQRYQRRCELNFHLASLERLLGCFHHWPNRPQRRLSAREYAKLCRTLWSAAHLVRQSQRLLKSLPNPTPTQCQKTQASNDTEEPADEAG